jgi:hypothetical protein
MRAVKRTDVQPGQTFCCVEDAVQSVCVALDAQQCGRLLRRRHLSDDRLWHVYVPTGELSWTWTDSVVYVQK